MLSCQSSIIDKEWYISTGVNVIYQLNGGCKHLSLTKLMNQPGQLAPHHSDKGNQLNQRG